MNHEIFLVTTVGDNKVCAICHEGVPFIIHQTKNGPGEICARCYAINVKACHRWGIASCVECRQEQECLSDLLQIHDVLEAVDGRYPIKRVCKPCRDNWWERVQDAIYGYWPRRIARAIDIMLALLVIRAVSRRNPAERRRKAA